MLVAFALAIMADPISSVAYAIEAALGELNSDLRLILPTMGLVVLVIGIIVVNYRQLVSRFPQGGGAQRLRVGLSAGPGRSCRSGRS